MHSLKKHAFLATCLVCAFFLISWKSAQKKTRLWERDVRTYVQEKMARAYDAPAIALGRLTLETAVPVSTTDQTGKTTLYYTPFFGNRVAVYDGSTWTLYSFSELSLALGTLVSDTNYDVLLWNNGGTLTLQLATAWASATARVSGAAGELELLNGVYVNKYAEGSIDAQEGRYLGTIRTTSTTTTEDSLTKRFVWNYQNRVMRPMKKVDTTDSWTYGTTTYRSWNNSATNRFEMVAGLNQESVGVIFGLEVTNSTLGHGGGGAIGLDSTSTPAASIFPNTGSYSGISEAYATYIGLPGLGYHYLQLLEVPTGGTATFYGDGGTTIRQSGALAWLNN